MQLIYPNRKFRQSKAKLKITRPAYDAYPCFFHHSAKAHISFFIQAKVVFKTPLIVIGIHIHSSYLKVERLGSDTAAPQGKLLLSDKRQFVGQRYSLLPSPRR